MNTLNNFPYKLADMKERGSSTEAQHSKIIPSPEFSKGQIPYIEKLPKIEKKCFISP